MADRVLAQSIVDYGVIQFGENMKNKHDSPSCKFDVRRLLGAPDVMSHIGEKMAYLISRECSASAVMGVSTSGIPWATLAGLYARMPVLYVRKSIEHKVSDTLVEGIRPVDGKVVLIDDLIFAGEVKRGTIEQLQEDGIEVTDIVVVVDRQLQRKNDGPSLQEQFGVNLHSLITMSQVVDYMREADVITEGFLERLREDYRRFERWHTPSFAR